MSATKPGQAQPEKGMIFLDSYHPIIVQVLTDLLGPESKREPVEIKFADFDDAEFRIFVASEDTNVLSLSLKQRASKDVMPMGSKAALDALYPGAVKDKPDAGYDVTLSWKIDALPKDEAGLKEFISKASTLKQVVLGSPLTRCFEALAGGGSASLKPMIIPFRQKESIYISPLADRILIFFSIYFMDDTDKAIATVFLQEFAEAQRRNQNAPAVAFSRDAPAPLKQLPGFKESPDCVGYVQFTMFKQHVDKPEKIKLASSLFIGFRTYLHYHVKGAKSYLQSRMRSRVETLLKVLNRANPDAAEAEKAAGRRNTTTKPVTFRRF